jgi:excisionase family DNA binding protein
VEDEFLSVPEVAERLRVSTPTVYRWIDEGALAALRIGRQYRIRTSVLERLIQEAAINADDAGPWSGEPPTRPTIKG